MRDAFFVVLGAVGIVMGAGTALVVLTAVALQGLSWWRRWRRGRRWAALATSVGDEVAERRREREQRLKAERAASCALLPTSSRRVRREPCGASGRRPAGT
jgi:hypothetical protein